MFCAIVFGLEKKKLEMNSSHFVRTIPERPTKTNISLVNINYYNKNIYTVATERGI